MRSGDENMPIQWNRGEHGCPDVAWDLIESASKFRDQRTQPDHKRDQRRDLGCLCDLIQAAVHDRAVLNILIVT